MFEIALKNVLMTLLYAAPGYLLCKSRRGSAEHLPTLSAVLVYILSPCLPVSAFLDLDFSWPFFGSLALFFAVTLVLQSAFMLLLYLVLRRRFADVRFRIVNAAAVLGNVGFFGIPIIRALLPDHPEVAGYAAVYIVSMNILVFTVGVYCLTGKKEYMSLKPAVLNPTVLGLMVALPLFFTGGRHYLPPMLTDAIHLLGRATTPICMIILGMRLATVPFRQVFSQPLIYFASFCKLLLFPLFCYACVYFLPLPAAFKASVLILSAAPGASIVLSLSEIHHSDSAFSANFVLCSVILCLLTIPPLATLIG